MWVELKTVDSDQAGSKVVSLYGTVDGDDVKAIANGAETPDFVFIQKLMSFDSTGQARPVSEIPWNGKTFMSGSIYVRTENIITMSPLNEKVIPELEKAAAR